MERLHDAVNDPRYDLVIVDTPPAQSSVEILDAPARLVRFLDQRVVRWFLQASNDASGRRAGTMAQRLLRIVAGASLVATLTEFLTEMAFLREGFAERARDVRDLMRSSNTCFMVVSSADAVGIAAARSVVTEVSDRGFELTRVVFNRAFIPGIDLSAPAPVTYPPRLVALAPKLRRMRELLTEEQTRKRSNMVAFCREQQIPAWALPEATRPLADVSALAAWIEQLRPVEPPA
jgi:anion-transporting  ArsA/GET3 family ATPase